MNHCIYNVYFEDRATVQVIGIIASIIPKEKIVEVISCDKKNIETIHTFKNACGLGMAYIDNQPINLDPSSIELIDLLNQPEDRKLIARLRKVYGASQQAEDALGLFGKVEE